MNIDVITIAKNIADTIYDELPDGISELQRREIAQKIAIEVTSKMYSSNNNNRDNAWFEYELWCEYELMLSSDARRKIYEILQNIK